MTVATDLAARIEAAFNDGKPDDFAACFAPEGVQHHPFFPEPNRGRSAIADAERGMFQAFDNIHFETIRVVDGGEWASFEFTVSARHCSPLSMPDGSKVPATNKTVDLALASIVRIGADGLIEEEHRYQDNLAFLRQLGLA